MRHGQGTRYNTDVHNAVGTIKKYNADQKLDEKPYGLGQRAGDTLKGFVPGSMGRMAKGRRGAGKLANQVNDEWQTFMGTKGYKNAEEATIKDLTDFIEKVRPGTDSKAFFDKAKIAHTNSQATITTDQQDAVVGELGAALAAQGAGQEPAGDGAAGATGGTGATGGAGSATRSAADIARGASGGTRTDPSVGAAGDPPTTPTTPTTPTPPPAKAAELANFIETLDQAKKDELANILNLVKNRG